jgi:hypothetical protein
MTLVVRVVRMNFLDCCRHLERELARKHIQGSLSSSALFSRIKIARRKATDSGVDGKDSRLDFLGYEGGTELSVADSETGPSESDMSWPKT